MVTSAIDGYHSTIFAYGQTGAGKTFTMIGTKANRGVNHRALQALFTDTAAKGEAFEYSFKVRCRMSGVLLLRVIAACSGWRSRVQRK